MTEPTRDALHAETLVWLKNKRDSTTGGERSKRILAHAAACVKRVPELEAVAEFRRCELEAVRLENLGVRAENKRLEAEVERLRAMEEDLRNEYVVECVRFVAALDSGEITHAGRTPNDFPKGKEARVFSPSKQTAYFAPTVLAAYAAATREGTRDA